jgi:hypothetical protein
MCVCMYVCDVFLFCVRWVVSCGGDDEVARWRSDVAAELQ